MRVTMTEDFNRPVLRLHDGNDLIGVVRLEQLDDHMYAPHIDVFNINNRRKGYCSMMLDHVYMWAILNRHTIVWEDEPRYKAKRGVGYMSIAGQTFADVYRARRNLPIPPAEWRYGILVWRRDPDKAVFKTHQAMLDDNVEWQARRKAEAA